MLLDRVKVSVTYTVMTGIYIIFIANDYSHCPIGHSQQDPIINQWAEYM